MTATGRWFRERGADRRLDRQSLRGAVEMTGGPIVVVLGHGASGSAATMAPHVAGLRARGIAARAVDLPRGRAERAVPVFAGLLATEPDIAVGGHSFGGRVASLAAAHACDAGRPPLALVLLSYPLHAPGRPEAWDERTAHWSRLTCPVLLLGGSSDPFATPALLERALAERLPAADVVTYPRLGHSLAPVLEDVLDRVAAFLGTLADVRREAGRSRS
jgi:predicted alpha/beta-hydrolase family hydrolase